MAAPNYDAMADGASATDEDPEEADAENAAADNAADDDEFMMNAEEAGFTGEKAKAFWRAVARCVELTKDGPLPAAEEERPLVG